MRFRHAAHQCVGIQADLFDNILCYERRLREVSRSFRSRVTLGHRLLAETCAVKQPASCVAELRPIQDIDSRDATAEPAMADEENEMAAAESNIKRARNIVEQQKQRVAFLEKGGADSRDARQTLDIYETNLRIFEGHRDYLKGRRS